MPDAHRIPWQGEREGSHLPVPNLSPAFIIRGNDMATCNVCGRHDNPGVTDIILNKLFSLKNIYICDNICRRCYYWSFEYFDLDINQPFHEINDMRERNVRVSCNS